MVLLFIEKWGTLILAAASLIVGLIALAKSSKAQKLQNKVAEIELKIKDYELEKIAEEKAKASLSCVEARVIKISNSNYKLKVWNSGNVTVYNVSATFEEGSEIVVYDTDKMPYDELEPNKNFEVNLLFHFGSVRKFKVTTSWEDSSGRKFDKVQTLSI